MPAVTPSPAARMEVLDLEAGVDCAAYSPAGGVDAAADTSSVESSATAASLSAGLAVLDDLEDFCVSKEKRVVILFAAERLMQLLQVVPFLYLYPDHLLAVWLAFLPQVMYLAFPVLLVRADAIKAIRCVRKFPAAVREIAPIVQQYKRHFRLALLAIPVLTPLFVVFVCLPSNAPIAWQVAGSLTIPLSVLVGAMCFKIFQLPYLLVQSVELSVRHVADTYVRGDGDVEQLRVELQKLAGLFEAVQSFALLTLADMGVYVVILVALASFMVVVHLNVFLLALIVLFSSTAFISRLPAADAMTEFEDLQRLISRRMLSPSSTASRADVQNLLLWMEKSEFGWRLGSIPITAGLLARSRAVIVPVTLFLLRELR
eukprot:PLAT10472.1.p1 GENE.PLAT10472.1~~PLAT10472.1.p1  ORF type:complete len:380 (+),score=157.22 PLAT10472.1:22-1140(+)